MQSQEAVGGTDRADGPGHDFAKTRRRFSVGSFDAALIEHMQEHLATEHGILSDYAALAACDDEPVAYLAGLILEEEQRHHQVLTEMLNQFHVNAGLESDGPRVPWLTHRRSMEPRELRRRIRRLRAFERNDLRSLRQLHRRLGVLRRDSLNGVLVRALAADTRKHLLYLRALDRIARSA